MSSPSRHLRQLDGASIADSGRTRVANSRSATSTFYLGARRQADPAGRELRRFSTEKKSKASIAGQVIWNRLRWVRSAANSHKRRHVENRAQGGSWGRSRGCASCPHLPAHDGHPCSLGRRFPDPLPTALSISGAPEKFADNVRLDVDDARVTSVAVDATPVGRVSVNPLRPSLGPSPLANGHLRRPCTVAERSHARPRTWQAQSCLHSLLP